MLRLEDGSTDAAYGDLCTWIVLTTSRVIRTWRSGTSLASILDRLDAPHPAFFMRRSRYLEWGGFDVNVPDRGGLRRVFAISMDAQGALRLRTGKRSCDEARRVSNRRWYLNVKSSEDARAW